MGDPNAFRKKEVKMKKIVMTKSFSMNGVMLDKGQKLDIDGKFSRGEISMGRAIYLVDTKKVAQWVEEPQVVEESPVKEESKKRGNS